jgi:inhibitor of the pro-sigma K processing machinery
MVESTIIVAFAVGMLALCIIGKLVKLPVELLIKFVSNSVVGALMLCVVNVFGLGIQITILKALIAGILGIPGVLLIVIWDKLL